MAHSRITVRALAGEADVDIDEALITLWDAGFSSVLSPSDSFDRGESNRARRALGLPTRRERASIAHWLELLDIDLPSFNDLLPTLGLLRPYDGAKLTKKAQSRLAAFARQRGVVSAVSVQDRSFVETTEETPPLVWEVVGHENDLHCLEVNEVVAIHDALVSDFDGGVDPIQPAGVKNANLLASAVGRPLTSIAEVRKYPTIEMGAAALLHAIVHDHPFHNGNKRTALVAMIVFLDANGLALTCNEDELFKLVLQLAQHALAAGPRQELADREVLEVAKWLRARVRRIEKGDRLIKWRHLRRLLVNRGCVCDEVTGSGNRIEISREIIRAKHGFLGRDKRHVLRSTLANVSDGREIDKGALKRIRRELEVDEEHGIDAAAFYDDAPTSPSEFIKSYQQTLRRLAKL